MGLMPNHVHFVVVPKQVDSLTMLFRQVHRHYSRRIKLNSLGRRSDSNSAADVRPR